MLLASQWSLSMMSGVERQTDLVRSRLRHAIGEATTGGVGTLLRLWGGQKSFSVPSEGCRLSAITRG